MDPDADLEYSGTNLDNVVSIRQQMGVRKRQSIRMPQTFEQSIELATEVQSTLDRYTSPFESKIAPSDMRQLALVAHNHMKPAMKEFIQTYSEVLKKFRITGTNTTMRMCKSLWGENNPDVEYGLSCTSGPLGGDAQIAALMVMEDLGGIIFFVDPLSAHPHQADIDSLIRLANCGNVILCINPSSAMSMMSTFRCALEKGNRGMIPSFFQTLESPAVAEYKLQQELALTKAINANTKRAEEEEDKKEDAVNDEELEEEDDVAPLPTSIITSGRRASRVTLNLVGIKTEPEKKQRRMFGKLTKGFSKRIK